MTDKELKEMTTKELLVALGNTIEPRDPMIIHSVTYGQYDWANYEDTLITQAIYCDGIKAVVSSAIESGTFLLNKLDRELANAPNNH